MALRARIYRQPKTAMQSGRAGTHEWVLDFEPSPTARRRPADGLERQRRHAGRRCACASTSREEAVAYAEQAGLSYDMELPRERKFVPKSYADNFRFGRIENWTH